jgi:PKD repeat protein
MAPRGPTGTTEPPGATDYLDLGLASGTEYFYRVRASSASGDSGWSNVSGASTLGLPPIADFSFLNNDLQVNFADQSTDPDGGIVAWSWDFGDGAGSTAPNPSHVYGTAATWTVTLTVTDEDGYSDSSSQDVAVFEAPNSPPVADFSFAVGNLQASFTDASADADGTVSAWVWDFGDGSGASVANSVHGYAAAGSYAVVLTVTDNDGDTGTVSKTVTVTEPPPYSDYPAGGQIAVAGTVSGSYLATAADDGSVQSIAEQESGGRKSDRYSYLEHIWSFDIPAGDQVTVLVNAWRSAPADADGFRFQWSVNGGAWSNLLDLSSTGDGTPLSVALPAGTSGAVRIRVIDSNRTPGQLSLDSVYVDYLGIRVANGAPEPFDNDPPSGLAALATSSSSIALSWTDNGDNEGGFSIERSSGGGAFAEVATTGPNSSATGSWTDTGLSGATTYTYRVRAFGSAEYSAYSGPASATTGTAPSISLSATGYKVKGLQNVDLSWSGATGGAVDIHRNGTLLTAAANTGAYTDAIGLKGAGTWRYKVCQSGSNSACSGEETVVF